jgi:hypothetical protein
MAKLGGYREGAGRKAFEPTDKQRAEVSALVSFGIPQAEIAGYIGIDRNTLMKYFRDELDNSILKANAAVGKFLFNAASGRAMKTDDASHGDCLRAAMFWAKTRMKWSEAKDEQTTQTQPITINLIEAKKPE